MNFVMQTTQLTLRPFRVEDAPALHAIANQPSVLKWMPDFRSTVKETAGLIEYFTAQYPLANRTTARVMFAVELDSVLIGMVGIGNKKEVDNEIEIAYFISKECAGLGYITEAAQAVCHWAFQNLQLDYLMAIVETDNLASQRVVEKCGFAKVDTRMILNSGDTQKKPFYYYRLYNH